MGKRPVNRTAEMKQRVDRCCSPSQLFYKQDFLLRGTKSPQTCLNAPSARRKFTLLREPCRLAHTQSTKGSPIVTTHATLHSLDPKVLDVVALRATHSNRSLHKFMHSISLILVF
ncbi:hypothetical protein QQF64_011451 [Cirrhinus molitorella]|uniref:Uncharacterized protein n=1 Tax=Cirrhinus molitorella TaxID=172907 RepID=A0ABR3M2X6_9TELE